MNDKIQGQKNSYMYNQKRLYKVGSEANIFEAKIENTRQNVILRIPFKTSFSLPMVGSVEQEQRLQDEYNQTLQTLSQQRLQHVVEIIEVIQSKDGELYTVMEQASGNLKELIENYPSYSVDKDQKINLFCQIIYGINEIHSLNIIHRDIKFENILYFQSINYLARITLKLCDIGQLENLNSEVQDAVLKGTCYFRAPEIYSDNYVYTQKVDIWSAGIILLEMFNPKNRLKTQYHNNDHRECQMRMKDLSQEEIDQVIDDCKIDQYVKILIKMLLVKDPEERINASEIIYFIEKILKEKEKILVKMSFFDQKKYFLLLKFCDQLIKVNLFEEAEHILQELTYNFEKKGSNNDDIGLRLLQIISLIMKKGNRQQALLCYQQLQKTCRDPIYFFLLSEQLGNQELIAKANQHLDQQIESISNPTILREYALRLNEINQKKKAQKCFKKAIGMKDDPIELLKISYALNDNNLIEQAMGNIEKKEKEQQEKKEKKAIDLLQLCKLLIEKNNKQQTIKYFRKLMKDQYDPVELLQFQRENDKQNFLKNLSIQNLGLAIKTGKDYSSLLNLGIRLQKNNFTEHALKCFNKAMKFFTNTAKIYIEISESLMNLNLRTKAFASLQKALKLKTNTPEDYFQLAILKENEQTTRSCYLCLQNQQIKTNRVLKKVNYAKSTIFMIIISQNIQKYTIVQRKQLQYRFQIGEKLSLLLFFKANWLFGSIKSDSSQQNKASFILNTLFKYILPLLSNTSESLDLESILIFLEAFQIKLDEIMELKKEYNSECFKNIINILDPLEFYCLSQVSFEQFKEIANNNLDRVIKTSSDPLILRNFSKMSENLIAYRLVQCKQEKKAIESFLKGIQLNDDPIELLKLSNA